MKARFVNVPGEGLGILLTGFNKDDLDMLNLNKKQNSTIFSDLDAIVSEIRRGRKIAAIKAVREQTGWGLREAKEYIDKYIPRNLIDYRDNTYYLNIANDFYNDHVMKDFIKDDDFNV